MQNPTYEGCQGQSYPPALPASSLLQSGDGVVWGSTTPATYAAGTSLQGPPVFVMDNDGTTHSFSGQLSNIHQGGAYETMDSTYLINGTTNNIPLIPLALEGWTGSIGLADFVKDRNGNQVTFYDDDRNAITTGAFHIVDTLGRTAAKASSFGDPNGDTVSVSGMSQPYTLTWCTVNFQWSYSASIIASPTQVPGVADGDANNGERWCYMPSGNNVIGFNVNSGSAATTGATGMVKGTEPVVTAITLPNGLSYQLLYDNPNGDNPFGLLREINFHVEPARVDPLSEWFDAVCEESWPVHTW